MTRKEFMKIQNKKGFKEAVLQLDNIFTSEALLTLLTQELNKFNVSVGRHIFSGWCQDSETELYYYNSANKSSDIIPINDIKDIEFLFIR